jgi:hypothetical protein
MVGRDERRYVGLLCCVGNRMEMELGGYVAQRVHVREAGTMAQVRLIFRLYRSKCANSGCLLGAVIWVVRVIGCRDVRRLAWDDVDTPGLRIARETGHLGRFLLQQHLGSC